MGLGLNPVVTVCGLVEVVTGSRVRGGGPAGVRLWGHMRERVCEYVGAPLVRPSVHAQTCGRTGMTTCTRIRVLTPRPSGRRRGRKWRWRSGCRWVCWLRLPLSTRACSCSGSVCHLCPLSSCPGCATLRSIL